MILSAGYEIKIRTPLSVWLLCIETQQYLMLWIWVMMAGHFLFVSLNFKVLSDY